MELDICSLIVAIDAIVGKNALQLRNNDLCYKYLSFAKFSSILIELDADFNMENSQGILSYKPLKGV